MKVLRLGREAVTVTAPMAQMAAKTTVASMSVMMRFLTPAGSSSVLVYCSSFMASFKCVMMSMRKLWTMLWSCVGETSCSSSRRYFSSGFSSQPTMFFTSSFSSSSNSSGKLPP